MRLLSVVLLVCIVFLSSLGGMIKPVQAQAMDCCKKMAKQACHHHPEKKQKHNDCEDLTCPMMLSCTVCGFVITETLMVQVPKGRSIEKPVAQYIQGDLATYNPDNWKPPRVC